MNLKCGQEPGVQFYTHISDQYTPFHTKVINATVRDATYVLDGLLYHESDLRNSGQDTDEKLLPHLSLLGWEHISLTGDYIWQQNKQVEQGKFRPLRTHGEG